MMNQANRDRQSPYLVKVQDAVAILNVSRSMVYKMIDCGDITAVKFGRSVRIPYSEIIDLIYGKEKDK